MCEMTILNSKTLYMNWSCLISQIYTFQLDNNEVHTSIKYVLKSLQSSLTKNVLIVVLSSLIVPFFQCHLISDDWRRKKEFVQVHFT